MDITKTANREAILDSVIAFVRDVPSINERGLAMQLRANPTLPPDLEAYAASLEAKPRQVNQGGLLYELGQLRTTPYQ